MGMNKPLKNPLINKDVSLLLLIDMFREIVKLE